MEKADLAIKGGRILTLGETYRAGIAIKEGKIICIANDLHLPSADETIDVKGNFVLPGIIDGHVHFKDLGRSDWEDFSTGTQSAAAGGVTTVLEMPQTLPSCIDRETFELKKKRFQEKAIVNMGLYGAGGTSNARNILELASAGVIGFKSIFGRYKSSSQVDTSNLANMRFEELKDIWITDDEKFLALLEEIAKTNVPCCVHAENTEICEFYKRKFQGSKPDLRTFLKSRPSVAEVEAIIRAILFASQAGARCHICHLSSKGAVAIVKRAKLLGKRVTAETCPHYLKFSIDDVEKFGSYAKVTPPIRERGDRQEIWTGLLDGTIDIISSDHAPFSNNVRKQTDSNIWDAPAGIAGVEAMLPLMLTFVNEGKISLTQLVKVMSENPARVFGLFPSKGAIRVGADADLTVVDMKKVMKLNADKFYTKARSSVMIYDGMEVKGVPILTIVNGRVVMENNVVVGKSGDGRFVQPKPANLAL